MIIGYILSIIPWAYHGIPHSPMGWFLQNQICFSNSSNHSPHDLPDQLRLRLRPLICNDDLQIRDASGRRRIVPGWSYWWPWWPLKKIWLHFVIFSVWYSISLRYIKYDSINHHHIKFTIECSHTMLHHVNLVFFQLISQPWKSAHPHLRCFSEALRPHTWPTLGLSQLKHGLNHQTLGITPLNPNFWVSSGFVG